MLIYIIVWDVFLNHGYQKEEIFNGAADIKVKGNSFTKNGKVVDTYEIVNPPFEINGAFITTNYFKTIGQTKSVCLGNETRLSPPAEVSESCVNHKCEANKITANGITTGNCNITKWGNEMCEIKAWCPIEYEIDTDENILESTSNFTLLIRIDGIFPSFPEHPVSNGELDSLYWNYNLFYLGDIVAASMSKDLKLPKRVPITEEPKRLPFDNHKSILKKGLIILMDIEYNCDLDKSWSKCEPKFEVNRIDVEEGVSTGFNHRHSYYYYKDGIRYRDLYKFYGIHILVSISGVGNKFNLVSLLTAIGSGIGLLSFATLVADMILENFDKHKKKYLEHKYEELYFDAVNVESNLL